MRGVYFRPPKDTLHKVQSPTNKKHRLIVLPCSWYFFSFGKRIFFFPCTYSKDPHPGRISINPSQQCCGFKDFPQLQDAVMLHNHWSALNEGFRGSSSYRFFGCQFPWATLTTQTPKRQPKALRWRWCLTGPLEHFLAYGWSSTEATAPRELVRGSEWTRSKANCHSLATESCHLLKY